MPLNALRACAEKMRLLWKPSIRLIGRPRYHLCENGDLDCHPCSPASMRSNRRSNRCAVAFFIAPENSGSLRHSVIVSALIPARRLASSSVNPMAIASAILATTSGVRLVGRPSPSLPRLLMLCAGSLFMPSCHFSFFVRTRQ